jgi:pyroglutamyl-peptidase
MSDPSRTTVLLTGFEPFPTQPVNATQVLVPQLAAVARQAFPDIRVHAEILPTEWREGPRRWERLVQQCGPDIALSFGISSRARGFEIETRGQNRRTDSTDAADRHPDGTVIWPGGPDHMPAQLPVGDILRRLRRRGIAVKPSRDAGGYICNALLYHAASLAPHCDGLRRVGFVHLPAELGVPTRRQTAVNASSPLNWNEALIGGLEIIAACLGRPVADRLQLPKHRKHFVCHVFKNHHEQ